MTDEAVTDLTRGVYRRLYSGFTTGQRINKVSLHAEAWFWRVLATVDDFGNGRAEPHLCRDSTAGNRQRITAKQIAGWLQEMADVGLISFYTVKGERFLHVHKFELTQPAGKNGKRLKRYPGSDESDVIQVNPDSSSASDNDTDPHSDPDSQDDNESKSPAIAGASAVRPKRDAVEFTIWTLGVGKLISTSTDERAARSFLGKQCQAYGKQAVSDAITKMLAEEPAEPKSYLVAILQNRGSPRGRPSKVDQSLAAVRSVIQEYEANEH